MKGIMFKEPLFLKVAAGEKTQTRRIMKPKPNMVEGYILDHSNQFKKFNWLLKKLIGTNPDRYEVVQGFRSRYKIGDIVYLKEPYFICKEKPYYLYGNEIEKIWPKYYWKNKLFQPESAARYFIKITNIRVQRVNDITEADAIAEGLKSIADFHNIWITIHGWNSLKENPWVYAYKFELTNKPILL